VQAGKVLLLQGGLVNSFYKEKCMNSFNKTLGVLVLYLIGILSGALVVLASGCGTIYGVASDIEEGSRAIRKVMEPSQMGLRDERVRRAADLVLADRGYQKNETPVEQD